MPAPTRTAPAAASASPDFNLKPPVENAPAAVGQGPAATTGQSTNQNAGQTAGQNTATVPDQNRTGQTIDASALPGEAGLSGTEAVVGTAILLLLAVGIFFVRGAVRTHLISNRASPSAAGSAGWALFALLLGVSVLVLFGLLGNLWGVLAFTVPLSLFILLMLVLFVLLYRAAARGRQLRQRS